jgi:hypothetical protein
LSKLHERGEKKTNKATLNEGHELISLTSNRAWRERKVETIKSKNFRHKLRKLAISLMQISKGMNCKSFPFSRGATLRF